MAVLLACGQSEATLIVAGWDVWDSAENATASVTATGVSGSAVSTTEQVAWNTIDERGASDGGDWGTLAGPPAASTAVADGENVTLSSATTGGTWTFSITNSSADDIVLDSFHFDAYAFRPKAPRTYELSVLSGGALSDGVVFTSAAQAITSVGGANSNSAHDDIDLSLAALADTTLEAGGTVQFLLAFSGGAGDGAGGHHLFLDNVGISGNISAIPEPSGALLFTIVSSAFAGCRRMRPKRHV